MQAVDQFQDNPAIRAAICNIIAGGVGITLTAGTHVIFQDLDWTPANHAQAEDRHDQRRRQGEPEPGGKPPGKAGPLDADGGSIGEPGASADLR